MINQDTLPNFTIDQKDDVWELSINKTKAEAEAYDVQDEEDIKNKVINTINNLIKTYPKDPLITSYISPQLSHTKTYPNEPLIITYKSSTPTQTATPPKTYPKELLIITNKAPHPVKQQTHLKLIQNNCLS